MNSKFNAAETEQNAEPGHDLFRAAYSETDFSTSLLPEVALEIHSHQPLIAILRTPCSGDRLHVRTIINITVITP